MILFIRYAIRYVIFSANLQSNSNSKNRIKMLYLISMVTMLAENITFLSQSLIINIYVDSTRMPDFHYNYILMLNMVRKGICINFANRIRNSFSASKNQTIYALSSGVNSAISIVRISGPQAHKVLNLINNKKQDHPSLLQTREKLLERHRIKPREMMLRPLYSQQKGLIDKCMMVYFQAGKSYSGEDLFELHLHGSKAIVLAVFEELAKLGFSPAKRGQFTRRAIQNEKMDLLEAQAINDLIHSELQFQRQVAIGNLMGRGAKYLQHLRGDLIKMKSLVESYIEFEEQEIKQSIKMSKGLLERAKQDALQMKNKLKKVIESSLLLQKAKQGVKVAIVGRPNVGKSTLINALVKKDVAIVSEIPGTTRDLIESSFQVGGYRVDVIDTAGMRESQCPIQRQGMRRSITTMQQSQITLVVFDISQSKLEVYGQNLMIMPHDQELKMMKSEEVKFFIIVNKLDKLQPKYRDKKIKIMKQDGASIDPHLCCSFKEQQSIKALTQSLGILINSRYNLYGPNSSELYFTRTRYISALQSCLHDLQLFLDAQYADMCSHHLDNALRTLQEVIGRVDSEEVLDQIFSSFCIGK